MGFIRGDAGQSAGGEATFVPDMSTSTTQEIPAFCRYFKCGTATTLRVQLRLDLASFDLYAVAGTNIENVKFLFRPSATSTVNLTFHG